MGKNLLIEDETVEEVDTGDPFSDDGVDEKMGTQLLLLD
jgi:hypothetical protein